MLDESKDDLDKSVSDDSNDGLDILKGGSLFSPKRKVFKFEGKSTSNAPKHPEFITFLVKLNIRATVYVKDLRNSSGKLYNTVQEIRRRIRVLKERIRMERNIRAVSDVTDFIRDNIEEDSDHSGGGGPEDRKSVASEQRDFSEVAGDMGKTPPIQSDRDLDSSNSKVNLGLGARVNHGSNLVSDRSLFAPGALRNPSDLSHKESSN